MLTNQIATFKKVSLEQYIKDVENLSICVTGEDIDEVTEEYNEIKLPSRATAGSVGYDFYLPRDIVLGIGEFIVIPTGIRCEIQEGYSLDIYPKSGLGFKNFTTLANTVGIIDADYYVSDNEGHIMVKLVNRGFNITKNKNNPTDDLHKRLVRHKGESFVQGIFHECFAATNDNDNRYMKIRNGGFDSTK